MFDKIKSAALAALPAILLFTACRKKDQFTIPQLTTLQVVDVANGTAGTGGTIISDGGKQIVFSGIAWSKTNQLPTIADDTTKNVFLSGTYNVRMKNVAPSSTYYIRAYAITEIGIGYGDVVSFTTDNGLPEARNLLIKGNTDVGQTLTASYTYFDHENNPEGVSTFQWYKADDAEGTGETLISGATQPTYMVTAADNNKFIRVTVTPKATAGTLLGRETKSVYFGAIGAATTITFNYNGSNVTYAILTSPVTGRKWLDRNLGAANAPSGISDFANYGDLFQWGRGADGHQLVTRSSAADGTPVNGTTNPAEWSLSPTDVPGHSLFILNSSPPTDWRLDYNDKLWQGANGINNPCPAGWRIPTRAEWEAEKLTSLSVGFNNLKLTYTGYRFSGDGNVYAMLLWGYYHTSTITANNPGQSDYFRMNTTTGEVRTMGRAGGMACRCIRN